MTHCFIGRCPPPAALTRIAARAWLALALMLSGCGAVQAASRDVASVAALGPALAAAKPGDVLQLAPGDYGTLELDQTYGTQDRPVTLTSTNPADPARFRNVMANGAEGIVLGNLLFHYTFKPGDDMYRLRVSQINNSRNIVIRDSVFKGDRARGTGSGADGLGVGQGLIVRGAEGIRIESSEFDTWYRGLVVSQSSGIVIRNNTVHNIRSDGADFAEVDDILIENNYFHDFDRGENPRDHADMIQFWTSGTKKPSRNITIRNNVFNSGHGLWTQSIFMRNELVDSMGAGDAMFYRDITITGNVIVNAHLHGITVGETDGLTVADNTLVRNPRSMGKGGSVSLWTPSIRVAPKSRNVRIVKNITPTLTLPNPLPKWTVEGNLLIQDVRPAEPGYYDSVFVAARQGDPRTLAPFTYLPGSPGAQGEVGAPRLRSNGDASAPAALIRVVRDPRFVNRLTFDAGLSQGAGLDTHWILGDGAEASGKTVTHDFATPGIFNVTLTVAQGRAASSTSVRVEVPTSEVLKFDPATGVLLIGGRDGLRSLKQDPVRRLADGTHVLSTGQGREAMQIDKNALAGFFGANDIALDVRLRAAGTQSPAGEVLRIHTSLILSITPIGGAVFWLNTSEAERPVTVATGPLRLHDGAWHDLGLRYNAADGTMSILVDGVLRNQRQTHGKIRLMQSWGLSLGNPFGKKSFDGSIASLSIRANAESFAQP